MPPEDIVIQDREPIVEFFATVPAGGRLDLIPVTVTRANGDLVKRLGADVVVDYKKQAFETVLHDYDLVLDSLGGVEPEPQGRIW
ncbi:hypothetical protein [Actinomadura rudentiformis]|uniref:hypothetical protein n=1 Tax=Actinomadura rudentiformis TaxID=359158 RepID=UPI001CEF9555|nr:hypothetical protein [Actinomadura rudentiformis]